MARLSLEFVRLSLKVERELYDLAESMADDDSARQSMLADGVTTILNAKEGQGPYLGDHMHDDIVASRLSDLSVDTYEDFDTLAAELALLASGDLVRRADQVVEAVLEVVGLLEGLLPRRTVHDGLLKLCRQREQFQAAARDVLGANVVDPLPRSRLRPLRSPKRRESVSSVGPTEVPNT
jgi:hypothetical protein